MPVAGLPAALDTLLTSLLATEEPTSWKVDGELGGGVVVVLRFRQRVSQPSLTSLTSDARGYWRKKTPAQRRRDQQRATEHRQKGERRYSNIFSNRNVLNNDVAKVSVCPHDSARDSHIVPTDYVTKPPVTFDPSHSDEHVEAATASVPNNVSETETTPLQDQPAPSNEATLEDFQRAMHELSQSIRCAFEEPVKAIRSEVAETCALICGTDHGKVSPLPSTSDQSLCDPEKPAKKTHLSSPAPSTTQGKIQPTLPSRSAVRQHDRDAASASEPERSRAPSTRQQPPRAARKT